MTAHWTLFRRDGLTWPARAGLLTVLSLLPAETAGADGDPPETIQLTGIVRDFREWTHPRGHPDFEHMPDNGFGHYAANVAPVLDDNGRLAFTGAGAKISRQWRDAQHRVICHALYDPARRDKRGRFSAPSTGGITSAESFGLWFQDWVGVNMSMPLTITLVRQDAGWYVFDDEEDPDYSDLGGFFPIDGLLFGNSDGDNHNYHFTFEIHTQFTYEADEHPFFMFKGSDTVLVFIDGRMVVDLGGVHAALDQFVDLSRLDLEDDHTYSLDFYFAQRFRPQSNFRIETNILLEGVELPTVLTFCD